MLIKLPFLPPTQNRYFIQCRGRLIKSHEARVFHTRCLREKLRLYQKVKEVEELFSTGTYLRVDTWYIMLHSRLIGQKSQVKQCDFMNFQKMAWDGLSEVIGIDDRWFKSGFHEVLTTKDQKEEGLLFRLSRHGALREYSRHQFLIPEVLGEPQV